MNLSLSWICTTPNTPHKILGQNYHWTNPLFYPKYTLTTIYIIFIYKPKWFIALIDSFIATCKTSQMRKRSTVKKKSLGHATVDFATLSCPVGGGAAVQDEQSTWYQKQVEWRWGGRAPFGILDCIIYIITCTKMCEFGILYRMNSLL